MLNSSEQASISRSNVLPDVAATQGCSNIFTEYLSSTYRSGVQRPLESLGQIAGLHVEHVETDDHLSGLMKAANVAGNATGQILDFVALGRLCGKAVNGVVDTAATRFAGAELLAGNPVARAALTAGTVGFVNGAALTPLQQGESSWRRLANGAVDAGAFAALGGVGAKYATTFGDSLLGRVQLSALSGAAGGATDSILDPLSHGRAPTPGEFIQNTAGWAIGNVVAGESIRALAKGAQNLPDLLQQAHQNFGPNLQHIMSGVSNAARSAAGSERRAGAAAESTGGAGQDAAPAERTNPAQTDAPARAADGANAPREKVPPMLDMRSMKEIAQSGDEARVKQLVDLYYPQLKNAFPLPGEIEDPETYVKYLMDPNMKWDMEQLLGPVQGGIQYQVLNVGGDKIGKAGWLEHIWVADHVREGGYGSALLDRVQNRIQDKGGDATFWEWNNPDKMTPDEIKEDEKGGITTQDRVAYWAKRGAYVAVPESTGKIAPYAQPGMDGQEEVPYLSLAWSKPGGLDGQTISKSDYLKTLLAAHDTITDIETDPTVAKYKAELDALPDTELRFVRLSDHLLERAQKLQEDHQAGVADADVRRDRWLGVEPKGKTLLQVADVPDPNPEVTRAQELQRASATSAPWNRTAPVTQRFSPLEGKQTADVVVVGAGVVGLQTAHELGSHGLSTIVLDNGLVGSGTSRFMGAMGTYVEDSGFKGIYDAHGPEGFAKRLNALIQSRASVQDLAKRYGADWQDVNSYNISYDANDPALKDEVDLLRRFGDTGPRFVTGDDAGKIFIPAKSAIIFPHEGNLNPYKFSLGLANSGKFQVHENSPVLGITVGTPGEGVDVFTPQGSVHARKVVFATNGAAPMFSYLNDHLVPVQCFATTADIGSKLPGNFFDTDSSAFTYWRQFGLKGFAPGETLIGGTARFLNENTAAADSPRLNARVQELFGPNAKPHSPITALIHTAYSDGIPIAGPHPKYPDVWVATGAGGTGLVNGNWIGRTIRQQLMQPGTENLISPDRFGS